MIRIKTQADIEILKEGGKRHAAILSILSALVRPGVSTQEIEDKARELINEGGDKASFLNYKPKGAKRAFPAALCLSINDEIVHGIPNENARILKEGDIVTLDLGLTHKGLITDGAITLPVGKISDKDAKLLAHTEEALYRGIKAAKGGNKVGDIGFAIGSFARGLGYGMAEGLAGHGVGYMVHEEPFVPNEGYPGKGEKLVAGMVIAIEPMLTLGTDRTKLMRDGYTFKTADGSNSAHFEHTVLITEGDAVILTKLPKLVDLASII